MDGSKERGGGAGSDSGGVLTPGGETVRLDDSVGARWLGVEQERARVGTKLGRFVVLEQVGAGGMGRVLRAHDPDLGREVAIKLMHVDSERAALFVLREARAMAQVNHPNVLPIYDVGEHEGSVFISMEYVQGQTLGQWLRSGEHGWQAVLEKFRDAGRGLAAAHAQGVIHRDFKPANVLVGADGRARVMDFGIATASQTEVHGGLGSQVSVDTQVFPWTQAGTVMGTPSYMAPEQHRGAIVDARGDQYSFCVALFEGLYGRHPFGPQSAKSLLDAKERGIIEASSRDPMIPRPVRRALQKGLSPQPSERWPSMEALLDALSNRTVRRSRWPAALVLGLGAAAALSFSAADEDARCDRGASALAGVWDEERRDAMQESFSRSGLSYAHESFERVRAGLDRYASGWIASHADACRATYVVGEQPEAVLDARMACLQERRRALAALVDELARADRSAVEKGTAALGDLPSVERCSDIDYVTAATPPPEDPAVSAAVEAVRTQLARARALVAAARYERAHEVAEQAMTAAASLDYEPIEAEAAMGLATAAAKVGNFDHAEIFFERAIELGQRNGMDELIGVALIDLAHLVGSAQSRPEESRRLAAHAEAVVQRTGDRRQLARLLGTRGVIATVRGEYDDALEFYEQALRLREQSSDEGGMAVLLSNIGMVHAYEGRYLAAMDAYRRVLEIDERIHGESHPLIAFTLNNIGTLYQHQGDLAQARDHFERALAILEPALGPEHHDLAQPLGNLANVLSSQGNQERALEVHRRALNIREHALGSGHPDVAMSLNDIGNVYKQAGDLDAALRFYRQALVRWEAASGPEHPDLAGPIYNLAGLHLRRGEPQQALKEIERALAIWEDKLDPDHPDIASALRAQGEALLALGRPVDAIAPLERSARITAGADRDPTRHANTTFLLARALWEGEGDRTRARELAAESLEHLRADEQVDDEQSRAIERWLRSHGEGS